MSVYEMEPLLPGENIKELEDLAYDLTIKATALTHKIPKQVVDSIGNLIRAMNCYYSNIIEDHHTHPVEIERALQGDYSSKPEKRKLQLEARAHIEVQKLIEETIDRSNIVDKDYICWIHKEFCKRLPVELLKIENPDTREEKEIIPGCFRTGTVAVGQHIPPKAEELELFLNRYQEVYNPENLSKIRQIIAVPAAHHRFVWIHPFYDGNGRVARMLSHAYFLKIGIGNALWSVSRGLARNIDSYKNLLMQADSKRLNDYDGRGNLSAKGLQNFCVFFLESCIDQVEFMSSLLEPETLLSRIEEYTQEQIQNGKLKRGSFKLIREAYLMGKFERGHADIITGYSERQARSVLSDLIKANILISNTAKGPMMLKFPADVVNRWFPKLYPENI